MHHNIRVTTVDYRSRQHEIDFVMTPYLASTPLSIVAALETLQLNYARTDMHYDEFFVRTTGLDALAVRPQFGDYPDYFSEPELPIPSEEFNKLTIDSEGIVSNEDGT